MNKKELKQLFEKMKTDNKEVIEELYNKYGKTIYAIAFSILKNKDDSEDVVQEVFIKIYNLDKDKLPTDKESTWIYTVTKNEALAVIKKKNKKINIEEIYEIEEQNNEIDEIIDKENFNKLISKLNDKEKEIVSLKIISNLSFKEIGKLLDEPINTIKWRYYKSIYRIKMLLSNLSIFLLTSILGLLAIKNGKKSSIRNGISNAILSEDQENSAEMSDTDFKEEYEEILDETTKELGTNSNVENESFDNSTTSKTETEKKQENIETENTITIEQETIVGTENQTYNTNYLGIATLGVSLIFLINTIIIIAFFKKHQLKLKEKSSKC